MEKRATFSNLWIAAAFVAPQLLLIFVFFYWPVGEAMYWSLTLEPPFGGGNQFVGLENFAAVFRDPNYWASALISVVFALSMAALSITIALALALLADRRLAGHQLYRFTFFLTYAVPAAAVGLAFRFLLAPDAGVISLVNRLVPGLWNPALDGTQALILVIVAQAWKMAGYNFVFLLAGLQAVPHGLLEAAALDGAGVLRRMRDIQIPLLTPTLFFLLVINITDSFVDSFGIVDLTTGGGPARSTMLLGYKIYLDGFEGKDYSLASAQTLVLIVLMIMLTFLQFRFIERRVHYR